MIDINLNKVSKSYGFDKVLNNIDLTINKGEKVALIGSNGSGKSTILKLIVGIENASSGDISIRKNITIGYLSQIPVDENKTVKEYIYDTFKNLLELKEKLEKLENNLSSDIKVINKYTQIQDEFIRLGGYEFETKISKVLSAFDITDQMLQRNFNTLSGGEKTICSLIRLLLIEPDVLILDEPTNHLDIKRMEWLENYLKSYKGTIILVSHDRYFIDKVVNKVILLTKRGLEIYFGNYTYFIKENENRIMLEFKKYKDQQKIIEAMKRAIKKLQEFGKLCGETGGEIFFRRAASIKKRLEKLEKLDMPETKKTINIDFNSDLRTGKDVLKIDSLNLSFGNKVLFDDANLDLYYKEKVCLIGDNGTGKSTLIKEILKGNPSIKLGSNIMLGYIPQEIKFINENNTVLEYFLFDYTDSETKARNYLAKYMFFGNNVFKRLKELSGGERVRLILAKLVLQETNFLILDEPTNHLDISTRELLEDTLEEYTGTILFVSHDRYFAKKIAKREIIISNVKYEKTHNFN